jgi:hypothetical protein
MARTQSRRSRSDRGDFGKSVFINCPFDAAYLPLLRPLLFTIIDLGFVPRIASDLSESGQSRIDRIVKLIRRSKYAIHDLSRIKASKPGELFRLNMPFELGIDVGCRLFKNGCRSKVCLILEERKYRYQAAISDMAGSDIAVHGNKPAQVVKVIRDWLNAHASLSAVGPAKIWARFNEFMAYKDDLLKARGFSKKNIEELSTNDLIRSMKSWAAANSVQ